MKLAAHILSIVIFVGLVVFLSRGVSNDTPGWGKPVVFPEFPNKPVETEGWAGQLGTGTEFITKE
jgi:hypothetical protein